MVQDLNSTQVGDGNRRDIQYAITSGQTRGLIYWCLDNRQNATADLQQASSLFRKQGDETYLPATKELITQIQSEG
ncbi:hypothetical protein [Chroococcidiopsis sp. TS-821]|uniref:hypothetical protein n=1 Tax=Chroococcidiopsis sp. TS-821 TaxID=1378066 RepID=UPI000CEEFD27|nr:hypothetical protein [Chroococcidiopsis sp. TS-821]PPS39858.1 hypothetical protein B1A85_21930 [Chroococcidiopsis sp. TS-821]